MKTFTFTIEQIKDIYHAGISQGKDESSYFRGGGDRYYECVSAIHDIVNEGKTVDNPDYVSYDTVRGWFAN
jgi:hypothetical protein